MIDRRVERTQLALHQALIALIVEKGYDAVTVKDILERANVGRSTFYAHYLGKQQLLQGGLDRFGQQLAARRRARRQEGGAQPANASGSGLPGPQALQPFAFSLDLFEHAQSYREVFRAMVGQQAGALVSSRMQQVLSGLVEAELAVLKLPPDTGALPPRVLSQFVVGALMSVLSWWVDAPGTHTAAELDVIFRRLALAALLEKDARHGDVAAQKPISKR